MQIAKYLLNIFNSLEKPNGFSVKNSLEVAEKLSKMYMHSEEEMISFDVTALYPSVPIEEAMLVLSWIESQKKL